MAVMGLVRGPNAVISHCARPPSFGMMRIVCELPKPVEASDVPEGPRKADRAPRMPFQRRYAQFVEALTEGYFEAEAVVESGRVVDLVFRDANAAICQLAGLTSPEELRGRTLREVDVEIDQRWGERLSAVATSGETQQFTEYSPRRQAFFQVAAFQLEPGRVAARVADVTDQVRTAEALRERNERLQLALQAAGIGIWSTLEGDEFARLDARMTELYGLPRDTREASHEAFFSAIHPEDRDRVRAEVAEAWRSGFFSTEYRVLIEGQERWYGARGRVIEEGDNRRRMLGVNCDLTAEREAQRALERLNADLERQVAERTAQLERRNQQLRRLTQQLSDTEQRERQRLSNLMSDELQQILVACKFQLALCVGSRCEEITPRVEQLLDQAIAAATSLAFDLSPPAVHILDLGGALRWLAQWFDDNHRLKVAVRIDPQTPPAGDAAKRFVFDAAREFLLNAVQHARVSQAQLRLTGQNGSVRLEVADSGRGFHPPVEGEPGDEGQSEMAGVGLFSLRERLAALGGRLEIDSALGQGARVAAVVPVADFSSAASAAAAYFSPSVEPPS